MLQVYKTPQKALEQYSRYKDLQEKRKQVGLSKAEAKELQNLYRVNDLVTEFERSHRYMITKDKFSQQDVDYAFSLAKKERQGGVDSNLFETQYANDRSMSRMKNPNASAAGIYQMMIMKDVFGGMKERFKENFGENYDMKTAPKWLEEDAENCVKGHKQELTTIIRGLKHTTDDPNEDKLESGFIDLLTRWIHQLFRKDKDEAQYNMMVSTLTKRNGNTMQEVSKIISAVMKEN